MNSRHGNYNYSHNYSYNYSYNYSNYYIIVTVAASIVRLMDKDNARTRRTRRT